MPPGQHQAETPSRSADLLVWKSTDLPLLFLGFLSGDGLKDWPNHGREVGNMKRAAGNMTISLQKRDGVFGFSTSGR